MEELNNAPARFIQNFEYPVSGKPVPSKWMIESIDTHAGDHLVAEKACGVKIAEAVPDEEIERAFENGRRVGIEEGRELERLVQAGQTEQHRREKVELTARLNEQFAVERDRVLRALEPEVVKLSLQIAERVLRREIEIDPLSLTGAIRVALGQLAEKTSVRLRVPVRDSELWNETLAHLPNLRVKPVVVADEELGDGECHLECDLGSADLSVQSQLQEIARSLLG